MNHFPSNLGAIESPHPATAAWATTAESGARRQRFPKPSMIDAQRLMTLLTSHDGSTTRLCEALAGAPVHVQVLSQRLTGDVPSQIRALLPGDLFIERITSLIANDEVMTDNLVYVALEGLDAPLQVRLRDGSLPIGRLMARRWLRREALRVDDDVLARLWRAVGHAHPDAMRCYRMQSRGGPAMVICETFRHGILSARMQP